MKRYQTIEQVIKKLKAAVDKASDDCSDARQTLREHGMSGDYKELNYRTIAGPFKVRDGEFRSNRWYFSPITLEATSYGWWHMLIERNGKLIWNACGYSMQTAIHQDMLAKAMRTLNIKPDIVVHTRANIGSLTAWKSDLLERYADAVLNLKYGRVRKSWRRRWVREQERELVKMQAAKIGLKFTAKDKLDAIKRAEERRASNLKWQRERRKRRKESEQAKVAKAVNASTEYRESLNVNHLKLVKE